MTPHIPEEFSTRLIDWIPFVIMGNTMPPLETRTKRKRTAPKNRRSCASRTKTRACTMERFVHKRKHRALSTADR